MQERDQLQGDLAPVLDAWPISGVQYRKINMFILPMPIQRLLTFLRKMGQTRPFLNTMANTVQIWLQKE